MKRKMVSFILCIAMCMALAIPAFAVELSPYATDEVGNFSQMIEFAFSDNVEGRFRYSYNDAAGNVVDGTATLRCMAKMIWSSFATMNLSTQMRITGLAAAGHPTSPMRWSLTAAP